MDSRKQFENHIRKVSPGNFDFRQLGGFYIDPGTQAGWELWNASRYFLLEQIRELDRLSNGSLEVDK